MFASARSFLARLKFILAQTLAQRILFLMVLSWIVTIIGFAIGLQNSDDKTVAVFLNWTSDVIFFTLIGIAASLISSFPPARESFEQRASILFQGLKGSQVEYARSLLNRLGNYSEDTRTVITINDEEEGWFRLLASTTHKLRNLIEDLRTIYVLPVIDEDQRGNPAGKVGKVLTFEVDGLRPSKEANQPGREAAYAIEIGGEAVRDVRLLLERWIGPGHHTAYTPIRFTKRFSLEFANDLDRTVFLKLEVPKRPLIALMAGARREELVLTDVEPVKHIYEFYLFRSRDEYRDWRAARARVD